MGFQERFQILLNRTWLVRLLKKINLPGLGNISLWEFLEIYISGLIKGTLTLRAAAVSWSLFLSIFPFILVVFALLPYMPYYGKLEKLLINETLPAVFPPEMASYISEYITDLLNYRDYPLFNFTTVLALFFATNGFHALINGFYKTGRDVLEKISPWESYLTAFFYTLSGAGIVFFILITTYYTKFVWQFYATDTFFHNLPQWVVEFFISLIFFLIQLLFMIFLYYFGAKPKIKRGMGYIFPGAFLTTVLFFCTLYAFRLYVIGFNNYQVLYGSIGIVMLLMLWVYINVIIILVGFELNIAILYSKMGISKNRNLSQLYIDEEEDG